MLNILKADFYKLKRQKSLWICLAVMFVLILFTVIIFRYLITESYEDETTGTVIDASLYTVYDFVYGATATSELLLLMSVIITLSFVSEFLNGTIKNAATAGLPRWKLFISQYIVSGVISTAFVIIATVSMLLIGLIFYGEYGKEFNAAEVGTLLASIGLQSLMMLAYNAVFMCIGALLRSKSGTLACCIILFSIVSELVYSMINVLYEVIENPDPIINIYNYSFYSLMDDARYFFIYSEELASKVWRVVYMSLAYSAVFGGLGVAFMYTRDI